MAKLHDGVREFRVENWRVAPLRNTEMVSFSPTRYPQGSSSGVSAPLVRRMSPILYPATLSEFRPNWLTGSTWMMYSWRKLGRNQTTESPFTLHVWVMVSAMRICFCCYLEETSDHPIQDIPLGFAANSNTANQELTRSTFLDGINDKSVHKLDMLKTKVAAMYQNANFRV